MRLWSTLWINEADKIMFCLTLCFIDPKRIGEAVKWSEVANWQLQLSSPFQLLRLNVLALCWALARKSKSARNTRRKILAHLPHRLSHGHHREHRLVGIRWGAQDEQFQLFSTICWCPWILNTNNLAIANLWVHSRSIMYKTFGAGREKV